MAPSGLKEYAGWYFPVYVRVRRLSTCAPHEGGDMDTLEGKGPQRRPQKPLARRLEEVAKAVGGGYCRLHIPFEPGTCRQGDMAWHRQGALDGGTFAPSNASLGRYPPPPTLAS